MIAIIRKELADYFNSVRFLVLFLLMLVAAGISLYAAQQGIREALEQSQAVTSGGFVFLKLFTSIYFERTLLTYVIGIIVPITGIALGFDAINSERSGGTLSRLLAQPVYRDSVINGKFLAGIIAMSLMVGTTILLVAGYGLRMIGVPPTAEEIIRLFLYGLITVIYGAFWMALAMLFSVVFRRAAGSLLVPLVLFIILFFFWLERNMGVVVAKALAPENAETQLTIFRLSPSFIYQEAYFTLLIPVEWQIAKLISTITSYSDLSFMLPNPLSLGQSLLSIWPHIVAIICLSSICFAISYIIFMKQEIRPQ
jgi:ABC-2 type transport system permease protein